jgi:hypothetical protein
LYPLLQIGIKKAGCAFWQKQGAGPGGEINPLAQPLPYPFRSSSAPIPL